MNAYETGKPAELAVNECHESLKDKLASINSTLVDAEVFSDQIADILYNKETKDIAKLPEAPHTMEEALDDIRHRVEDLARNLSKIKYVIGG